MTGSTIMASAPTYAVRPQRYRSLQTLLLLSVIGSLASSFWLLPSRLERVVAALDRGDQVVLDHELAQAAGSPTDPGETRALADVALTLGEPEVAAGILERSLERQPGSLTAIRHLLEIQRQQHRMGDVAALDERIYARTGDPEALREAADIYASQRRTDDRIGALRRLNDIGHATASDIVELAHRLTDADARAEASSLVMRWLNGWTKPLPPEVVALAAWSTANDPDASAVATQLGSLIGQTDETGPFHVLVQTYAERGHPDLSLVAGRALGARMQAMPEIGLLVAQLEALQGQFAAARRRLDELENSGKLLPGGLSLLAELTLQLGDLDRAAALTGAISADQMTGELPLRLVDAAFAAGRMDALSHLSIEPIAATSPGSAAVIALAQGKRGLAEALARRALLPNAELHDLGSAFVALVKSLGLERDIVARLVGAAKAGALDDQELSLLVNVSTTSRRYAPAVMQALRTQRDLSPGAGAAWAAVAARTGNVADVVAWLAPHAERMPTGSLIDLLQIANERASGDLARIAASAVKDRPDLPNGWTPAEITFAMDATQPATPARLREGLALLGAPLQPAAKDRVITILVGSRDFTRVAATLAQTKSDDGAIDWLVDAAARPGSRDDRAARLAMLAALAPHRSIPLLARTWEEQPRQLLPLYVAALMKDHQGDTAQTVLSAGLKAVAPNQQDAILYDSLAGLRPDETLPILRIAARSGRGDWASAYQEALAHAGLFEELQASLRAQAATPGLSPDRRMSIVARLVELNDRAGAIAILAKAASGERPSSPIVEQLIFLWGPRAEPDSIAWARDRAMAASLSNLPKWLDHLAFLGSPRTVIDVVESRPAILSASASAIRAYGAAMIAENSSRRPDLSAAMASRLKPDVASALAQLALDTGQAHAAWRSASQALNGAPASAEALLVAAQASASVRRSSEAAALYTQLLALGPQDAAVMIDAGDAMLTAKQAGAGRRVLEAALLKLSTDPASVGSARQRARALMLLKQTDEAVVLLRRWLARFPNDPGLQADLLQVRLDGAGTDQ